MSENEWTKQISEKLNLDLNDKNLYAKVLQKIPYSQEILSYTKDWLPNYGKPDLFETDLLIYEIRNNKNFPLVIIESKVGSASTHAAITYSHKAEMHKKLMPCLRYGIMLGNWGNRPIPGRLFNHGTNFDFMFRFENEEPSEFEWENFSAMILREIEYSKKLDEILHDTRSKYRKHYFMLEKQLILEEQK